MTRSHLRASRASSRRILRATFAVAGVAILATAGGGCGDSTGPDRPDYDSIDPIVFSQHVQPIFSMSCNSAACHNSTDAAFDLVLESYDTLKRGSRFGAMVVPFEPRWSHLYLHTTGDIEPRMPLGRDALPDDEIRFLKRWIEEGARDDDGSTLDDGTTRKAFVACQGENDVAVVDMDTGRLARLLPIEQPHSVYVDQTRRRLYVTRFENASDNLHVYDADDYELLQTLRVGTYPALMEATPDGTQLWVSNFHTGPGDEHKVHVLDAETLQILAIFNPQGRLQPHGLAISSDGERAFVANIQTDDVSVFATNAGRGLPTMLDEDIQLPDVGVAHAPQQCVLSPDDTRLYVSAQGTDHVYVFDASAVDDLGSTPVPLTGQVAVGDGPWHLTVSPDGTRLWVANWLESSVSVIDVSNPDAPVEIERLSPMHPDDPERAVILRPIGIAFSPDGSEVWVTSANDDNQGGGHHPAPDGEKNPGTVVVFDAATHAIKSVAEVPNFARFVSFLP
ncbi:MAG: beta-propeller fold lactonase family protein [bacterium]